MNCSIRVNLSFWLGTLCVIRNQKRTVSHINRQTGDRVEGLTVE